MQTEADNSVPRRRSKAAADSPCRPPMEGGDIGALIAELLELVSALIPIIRQFLSGVAAPTHGSQVCHHCDCPRPPATGPPPRRRAMGHALIDIPSSFIGVVRRFRALGASFSGSVFHPDRAHAALLAVAECAPRPALCRRDNDSKTHNDYRCRGTQAWL